MNLRWLVTGLTAYVLGSLSFALWITRWLRGSDLRQIGSKHATATNTMRAAGWGPGILVMLLDVGKGALAVWIAARFGGSVWAPALAAGLVVIGHCWPIWAGFHGGMGMASGVGALLVIWPLGAVLGIGLGAACQLIVRHSARANILTGLLLAPLWALFGARGTALAAAAWVGVIVAYRARLDWKRVYRELWWDRG